jgi:hypothetical protein
MGVDERDGGGSVFWFELPVETVQAPVNTTAAIDPKAELPVRSILVVEDNAVNRDVAERFLNLFLRGSHFFFKRLDVGLRQFQQLNPA